VQGSSIPDTINTDEPYPSTLHGAEIPISPSHHQVTPPAVQPLSYSRFPRRARSPLSLSTTVPSSPINLPSSFPPSPLSHPASLYSPRPRKRRNLYIENQGRIGDVWKYLCIERVETLLVSPHLFSPCRFILSYCYLDFPSMVIQMSSQSNVK
jgi:hypothetical protein